VNYGILTIKLIQNKSVLHDVSSSWTNASITAIILFRDLEIVH